MSDNWAQLDGGRFLADLYRKDSVQAAFMDKVINAINKLGNTIGANPVGEVEPPHPINQVNVSTSGEMMQVNLLHTTPVKRGINYFVEVDTNPNFNQPMVKPMGPSRATVPFPLPSKDAKGNMISYYVRAFAQYPGSKPSLPTVFGGKLNPAAVTMGGSTKMTLLPSFGSGTSSPTGQQGVSGFGRVLNSPTSIGPVQNSIGPPTVQAPIVTPTVPSTGDGLVHGETPWESDPAYYVWREDFEPDWFSASPGTIADNIPLINKWIVQGSGNILDGDFFAVGAGMPSSSFLWANGSTAMRGMSLVPGFFGTTVGGGFNNTLNNYRPWLDYPVWAMNWVFKFDGFPNSSSTAAFSTTKTAFYCGLSGDLNSNNQGSAGFGRPYCFAGARFDTDPGCTFTLSSVAAASGGTTVYTGTITWGGINGTVGLAGQTVVISGFTNGANNGTFIITTATSTTITVTNAAGVAETHAGTAVANALSDSHFVLEVVNNLQINTSAATAFRVNNQGITSDTGITPTQGTWYRLSIKCNAAGTLIITLSGGGQTATMTASMPQNTLDFSKGSNVTIGSFNKSTRISWSPVYALPQFVVAPGSKITIANVVSASYTFVNGSWVVSHSGSNALVDFFTNNSVGNATVAAGNMTGYPAVIPIVTLNNDSQASPTAGSKAVFVDYFSYIWNPGVNGGTGTPNSGLARYW